jgi:PKD repeat protein
VSLRYSRCFPILTVWLVAACGGDDLVLPGDGEVAIRVVDGDGQSGLVGEMLGDPVVVEVTDGGGDPVEGAPVTFALTSAGEGAEISPATARTDADGRAEARVLLGDKVGLQTGQASITGHGAPQSTATFTALASEASSPPESPPPPPPPSDNKRPQADFDVDCRDLRCSFDDKSKDDDGSITTRQWDFGDGSTSSERNPSHSYASAGDFSVTLTVTDNGGATDTRTRTAGPSSPSSPPPDPPSPPPAQNKAPHADFEVACQDLRCTFVDRSSDEDGSVARWEWDFGDGSTSSERNPSHTYGNAGKYDVLLVVTDDDGAADTRSHKAEPKSPPEPPSPPDPPSPPPPPPPPPPQKPAPHPPNKF